MNDKLPIHIILPEGFLSEEVRNDYTITCEMKKIWAVQLDLLSEFSRVCQKHNIQYMACGGTLLGAIRHKGYIPWDDDIDLMMKREEYEKLCRVAKEEFKHPYFFQTEYSDPGSLRGHAQLRNSLTTGILKHEYKNTYAFNQGVFIDIFPLDHFPDDMNEKQAFLEEIQREQKKILSLSYIAYRYNLTTRKKSNYYKRIVKDMINPIIKAIRIEQHSYKQFERLISKYNKQKTNGTGILCLPALGERFHYLESDINETFLVPFENVMVPVPTNYEAVLKKQYGDWRVMYKAPSVHGGVIFDVNTPYDRYIKNTSDTDKTGCIDSV